jgi:vacuolar-type H+-ATPase subunit H
LHWVGLACHGRQIVGRVENTSMDETFLRTDGVTASGEDALQQVLLLERNARDTLREAQEEAQRIVGEARDQVHKVRASAEERLLAETQALAAAAQEEIDAQTRTIREEAAREAAAWVQRASRHQDEALEYVLDVVTLRREA